jgi:hypothetical protein
VYDRFDECWSGWTYGPEKLPVPRPDNWRNSVAAFLSAGMPADVLADCVRIAMGSKASPDQTWRYMCGVAWGRIRELQKAARLAMGDDGEAGPEDGEQQSTLGEHCDYLLRYFFTPAELEEAFKDECRACEGHEDERRPGTTASVLWFAMRNMRMYRNALRDSLTELIDAAGGEEVIEAERERQRASGEVDHIAAAMNAAWELADGIRKRRAAEYMAALPEADREMWLARARAAHADEGLAEWMDEADHIARAADMAHDVAAGTGD